VLVLFVQSFAATGLLWMTLSKARCVLCKLPVLDNLVCDLELLREVRKQRKLRPANNRSVSVEKVKEKKTSLQW